jgi:signal transduction histidine kinase
MSNHLVEMPSLLVLGLLVALFFSLQRRYSSRQVQYWLLGWGLMFVHFLANMLLSGRADDRLLSLVVLSTVQLAGAAFLMSVSWRPDQGQQARWVELTVAVPLVAYGGLLAWQVQYRWPFLACIAAFFLAEAGWGGFGRGQSRFQRGPQQVRVRLAGVERGPQQARVRLAGVERGPQQARVWLARVETQLQRAGVVLLCVWTLLQIQQRGTESGFWLVPAIEFAVTAVMFARRFPRLSPGAITVSVGFLAWATVWAAPVFLPWVVKQPGFTSEFWHFPSLIVAFGMVVVLVEEESEAAQAAKKHLRQFADVTSRLLSGVEVKPYCSHIAQVFTEATTFLRVAIFLQDQDQHLVLAGESGWAESDLLSLGAGIAKLTAARAEELVGQARSTGKIAVFLDSAALEPYGVSQDPHLPGFAKPGSAADELIVPLRSPHGGLVGLILLDAPRDHRQITAEELSKIEMLAMDIAVAVNNAAMQRQLVLSEKLASVGQLVRGVAHEMNNPLTSILGYAELLADHVVEPQLQHGLEVILREGQRMKRIVANLSRFAQQEQPDGKVLDLLPLLREVLDQKAQEARNQGIELISDLAHQLPAVVFDERQLRQVFVNVLNNALEAVQEAREKRVTVMVRAANGRVILDFLDTGPGFTEPTRVFDPFFTTKSPGKGVGLGLSICYGVLRQHGGSINAANLNPRGACITIDLPSAPPISG